MVRISAKDSAFSSLPVFQVWNRGTKKDQEVPSPGSADQTDEALNNLVPCRTVAAMTLVPFGTWSTSFGGGWFYFPCRLRAVAVARSEISDWNIDFLLRSALVFAGVCVIKPRDSSIETHKHTLLTLLLVRRDKHQLAPTSRYVRRWAI